MTPPASLPVEVTGTLPLEQLDPDHWPNPRGDVDTTSPAFAELTASIAAQGMLEPIVVGPALEDCGGRHPIIAGWRRYIAALVAGTPTVPVHHRPDIADEASALRAALAENLAREDMTPLAEAAAIAKLVELGDTQVEAAAAVGVSERTARERLRLLTLPKPVQDAIAAGRVPSTAGRTLQLIADASPAAAVWIAKGLEQESIRAADLLDPDLTADLLLEVESQPEIAFQKLGGFLRAGDVEDKDLAKRIKAAGGGGDYSGIRLRADDELLEAARASGGLLEHDEDLVFLTDTDLIGEAIEYSIALTESERAEQAAERKAQQAKSRSANTDGPAKDPALLLAVERDKQARPYAEAMNAELGRRLRGMSACSLEGPVARLVLHLVDGYPHAETAGEYGYKHVDPERTLDKDWAAAKDPSTAAAELVRAYVAAFFCDPRATGGSLGLPYYLREEEDLIDHIRAAAKKLKLLPPRAIALDEARTRLTTQLQHWGGRGARRRILAELHDAPEVQALDLADLRAKTKVYGSGGADAYPIYGDKAFDQALEQLLEAGCIRRASEVDVITITAAGKAALSAPDEPQPIIDDIDADIAVPGLQLVDEEVPDTGDLTIMLEQPETSVPSRTRRARALELITQHPGITIPELAHGMALKQNALYRIVPALADDGLVRKDGRGWFPVEQAAGDVVLVHVTPTGGGDPVEAELQPDPAKGKSNSRKVIYTASRTAAWVAESRIVDLPAEVAAA